MGDPVLSSNRMLRQMEVIFMDSCDSHGRSNWYDVSDMNHLDVIVYTWSQHAIRITV